MTYKELKEKLENPSLVHDCKILSLDQTLGNTFKEQLSGMLFHYITGKIWCEVDDNDSL